MVSNFIFPVSRRYKFGTQWLYNHSFIFQSIIQVFCSSSHNSLASRTESNFYMWLQQYIKNMFLLLSYQKITPCPEALFGNFYKSNKKLCCCNGLSVVFFSLWVFFYGHSGFTGQQGKGEGIYLTRLYQFHPIHRHLDISHASCEASGSGSEELNRYSPLPLPSCESWMFVKENPFMLMPFELWSCWGIHEQFGVFYRVKAFLNSSSW